MARSRALSLVAKAHRLRFMVYVVAHTQAGARNPRNEAKADLAALYPDEYRQEYARAKAMVSTS